MDDVISRQAAIDAIRKIYDSVGILGEKWAVDKCQMAIKDLPSAQPEHGRWVDDFRGFEEFAFFRKGWKCSACGSRNTYGKPKHCPNCGARMDGESDE